MPDLIGIELARRVAQDCPSVRLVALNRRSLLARAIRAVAGLLLDLVLAGKTLANPPPVEALLPPAQLSPREKDVLRLTALGLSNKDVGGQLNISTKTVETCKARAAEKLALRSRADIVRYADGRGWLELDRS